MEDGIIDIVEQSDRQVLLSRLTSIKELEDNPMGVEFLHIDTCTAFTIGKIPGPSFNKIIGFRDYHIKELSTILSFYQHKSIPARFELIPSNDTARTKEILKNRGYVQKDSHQVLYQEVDDFNKDNNLNKNDYIHIRELYESEFNLYAKIYVESFHMPTFLEKSVSQNNAILRFNPEWKFYVASIEETAVGIAALHIKGSIGTLAIAATLPNYRNKGVHTKLLQRRMTDAKDAGCKLIVGQAACDSVSQRNMEKVGMRIAYTKSIWERDL